MSRRPRRRTSAARRRRSAAHAVGRAPQRASTVAEVQTRAEPLGERPHVRVATAGDIAPLVAPEAEHAVIVEEPDRRRRGVLQGAAGRRRPERRRQGDQKVLPETRSRSPARRDSRRSDGPVVEIRERALRGQQPASDLAEQREEARVGRAPALRKGFPARVLEPAGAGDRERHLRRLGRNAELRE